MKNKTYLSDSELNQLVINQHAETNINIVYTYMVVAIVIFGIISQIKLTIFLLPSILLLAITIIPFPAISKRLKNKFLNKLLSYNSEIIKDLEIAIIRYNKVKFDANMVEFCHTNDPINDGIQTSLDDYNSNLEYLREIMNEMQIPFSLRLSEDFLNKLDLLLIEYSQDPKKMKKIYNIISVEKSLQKERKLFADLLDTRIKFDLEIRKRLNLK